MRGPGTTGSFASVFTARPLLSVYPTVSLISTTFCRFGFSCVTGVGRDGNVAGLFGSVFVGVFVTVETGTGADVEPYVYRAGAT
jgi:hypothetical protein